MARFLPLVQLAGLISASALLPVCQAVAASSCTQTAGPKQAQRYVEQCLQVSPATHPPCNAANECDLIQHEIRRGCSLLGKDAPAFCKPHQHPG